MHKNGNNGPVIDTKWHYLGPDSEKYGPYMSKDMLFWLQAGYFNDGLQLKTENEPNYHTLGEWSQLLGTHPFSMPVHSLDATIAQMNSMRPHGAMMMVPPGLQNQFQPPMPMRFPPFLPMPLLHQMNQNGPPMGAQMHSQPPSEPIDAGSLSHTPDSENETRLNEQTLQQPPSWLIALGLAGHGRKPHHHQQILAHQHIPQMQHANVATDQVVMKSVECQTEPVEISKEQASRVLSELLGQMVIIN
ncbi:Suppressor of aph-1 [Caenorhabditis elegans]|uniref:Suppressor of aph-1 n=1 Tax=Caenorhabditis elegans TaxID=6239 RepID=SAO1_CAEEL|nr:Suppressor of aph-1 [Caenorhabditis elegans]C6KRN1.1 RecName: Full=Suppressor of aph-1 [Caenorhabditis elegans]CAZ65518.1 Suppressor of aph-1 [Caenorhabditis elegans]|eukprot:NP_001256550.1 Suppressor of aph-1 [Caenorhabditis elegans]